MKHRQSEDLRRLYLQELRQWNKVHRLVGSNDLDQLYAQSSESFKGLAPSPASRNVVDVGAGSGILGLAGLISGAVDKVALVEPDPKKSGFMIQVKGKLSRIAPDFATNMIILSDTIQNVSRETLEKFFVGDWILIARAFSGEVELHEAVAQSSLKDKPIFSFTPTPDKKFMLKLVKT